VPSYVIAKSLGRTGEPIEATLCDPGPLGFPDRKTGVPVQARLVSEQTLSVDGELHRIISSLGENGVTTFLINGSTKGLRNYERRVALARASGFLQQLTSTLMPLTAESEEPEYIAESLQLLSDWIARERERATTTPRLIGAPKGGPDDHASR
jgi:hypothetical protein